MAKVLLYLYFNAASIGLPHEASGVKTITNRLAGSVVMASHQDGREGSSLVTGKSKTSLSVDLRVGLLYLSPPLSLHT